MRGRLLEFIFQCLFIFFILLFTLFTILPIPKIKCQHEERWQGSEKDPIPAQINHVDGEAYEINLKFISGNPS